MTTDVQLKVTADIADLRVQMVAAQRVMRETERAANDVAKAIAAGDTSAEVRSKNLALTQSAVDATAAYRGLNYEYKQLTQEQRQSTTAGAAFLAQLKEQAATAGMSQKQMLAYRAQQLGVAADAAPLIASLKNQTGHMVSSRAATEGLVLVHEGMSGRYNRMAGSAMIMTQALIGQETISKAVTAAMTPMGAAAIGLTAAVVLVTVAEIQYQSAQRALIASTLGLGAASGLTAAQLVTAGQTAAEYSGQSVRASTQSAAAFAAAGVRSQEVVTGLASSMAAYASMTGQDTAEAQKTLAQAMNDPIHAAEQLNSQLGLLDSTQLEQIRTLTAAGDKTGAVAVIMQALKGRVDEAKGAGAQFTTDLQDMVAGLSNVYNWLGQVSDRFADLTDKYSAWNLATGQVEKSQAAQAEAAKRLQDRAQDKGASSRGGAIYNTTPEGQDAAKRTELAGAHKQLQDALAADTRMHGANSEAVRHDQAAISEYKRAIDTYLPSAEKAHKLAELEAQLAVARKGKDKTRVADLSRQKSAVETAGEVMSPTNAAQRASDAANVGSDKTGAPTKKKDDRVAQWTAELRGMEIASGEFFKDQTEDELKFWRGKVAAARSSAPVMREVTAKIYEASRTLARQDYQDHIADLNERIAADKNNWPAQQALIAEKTAFIGGKQGEEEHEYKKALQDKETAQRDHDSKNLAEAQRAAKVETDELKRSLDAEAKARDDNAKAAEVRIKSNSNSTPFGDIKADQQIAAMQQQLLVQKLADNDTFHAGESARLDAVVQAAKAKYAQDKDAYAASIAAKRAEDQRYADNKRTLNAQMALQQAQTTAQMQAKYASYIGSTVSTTIRGIDRMISGQMTLRNFGISVYQSIAREAVQQVEKMATQWITKHIIMAVASKLLGESSAAAAPAAATATAAASKAQVLMLSGVAGAGGVASMAAAPFPLDMDAPAFGAQMAAMALSMGSFAQGTNMVPNDMVAQIHAGERIIPKADNDTLLSLTARGAGAAGGGGTHNHHYNVSSTFGGQEPLPDQLRRHEDTLISIMTSAARRGVRFGN